jgi:Zn-dependent protease
MSENKKKGLWALLVKLGSKVFSVFLKLLKGLKMTKIGLAGVSFAGYALLYSWKFALLLMIAIGFHESGHVWAMKKMGIKTKGFYFLPFVGGAAIAEEQYKSYGQNVFIAIMGPIWGALLAYITAIGYWYTHNPLLAAAAAWMATLNLFNLLPIHPLDGGQIIRAISFSIHQKLGLVFLLVSTVLAVLLLLYLKIGLFVLFIFVGALELVLEVYYRYKSRDPSYRQWKLPDRIRDHHYPDDLSKKQLLASVALYVATIAALLLLVILMKDIPGADLAHNFIQ